MLICPTSEANQKNSKAIIKQVRWQTFSIVSQTTLTPHQWSKVYSPGNFTNFFSNIIRQKWRKNTKSPKKTFWLIFLRNIIKQELRSATEIFFAKPTLLLLLPLRQITNVVIVIQRSFLDKKFSNLSRSSNFLLLSAESIHKEN